MQHAFSGTVQLLNGSWQFMPEAYGKAPFTLPAEQVTSFDTVQGTRLSTLAVVLLAVATVVYFLYATLPGGIEGLN